ncbi:MAG TPA: EamA family transporter [Rectinemataceae bacterium]
MPTLAVVAAAGLGASSGLYIKGLAFSSLAMSSLRMTIPFLLALPTVAKHGLLLGRRGMRMRLFVTSALNAGRLYLFIQAFKLTSIGNAVVLLYLWPVFALLMDSLRKREKPGWQKIGVLALATTGVVALNSGQGFSISGNDLLGSACMILSALVYGGTAIVFKDALSVMTETDTLYFQNAIGGMAFLPFLIAEIPHVPLAQLGIGIAYGAAVGFVGFGLFFVGMKRLPLFKFSALSYSEVPLGLLVGILFQGEVMTPWKWLGIALVIAGSFFAQTLRLGDTSS